MCDCSASAFWGSAAYSSISGIALNGNRSKCVKRANFAAWLNSPTCFSRSFKVTRIFPSALSVMSLFKVSLMALADESTADVLWNPDPGMRLGGLGGAEDSSCSAGSSRSLRRAFDFGAGWYLTRDPVSSSNKGDRMRLCGTLNATF